MKRVLIVDDDVDLLKLYKQAFINASFEVDVASNIPEADKLASETKYDLIIADILFPGADILPTIRLIRKPNAVNSKTPILVLTNLEHGEKTQKALEYGANECLFKATQTPGSVCETALNLISKSNPINNH